MEVQRTQYSNGLKKALFDFEPKSIETFSISLLISEFKKIALALRIVKNQNISMERCSNSY
jgi:hypothetical protein